MSEIHLQYDPDFDTQNSESGIQNQHSVFESLSPKTAFYAGIVTAILGIGTIGFSILLFIFLYK